FIILLVTVPLFYFVVRSVLLHATDHSLRSQLFDIRSNLSSIHSQDELATWARLDKDISLAPADAVYPDHIYTSYRENLRHRDQDPYREIAGVIQVEGKFYQIVISSSLVENEDLLGSIVMVQTILLILLMAGILWINRIISKKVWQPFYSTLNKMQQYELNKSSNIDLSDSTINEFNELNKALRNLFNRNYEIYLQQKEFTENAAHEMQTPLAIFQSKLDLLMQTQPLAEEQAELIHALESTNRRLIRLNKSLLLLAKIENGQFPVNEEVNIAQLTKRIIDQSKLHAEEYSITVDSESEDPSTIKANSSLLEIMVGNLVSNAFRHNKRGGRVQVDIHQNTLRISNTGIESPLPDKIFDRFHKSVNGAEFAEGTGLGLAIVSKICNIYQYSLGYRYEDKLHAFTIAF
ncbi:MAG TPA: HAMP domain-containing sensor histidine kinase, partial [Puia sp.]|nr:HAMP domain-containing sensor histidine kinase [Puia sp.]